GPVGIGQLPDLRLFVGDAVAQPGRSRTREAAHRTLPLAGDVGTVVRGESEVRRASGEHSDDGAKGPRYHPHLNAQTAFGARGGAAPVDKSEFRNALVF